MAEANQAVLPDEAGDEWASGERDYGVDLEPTDVMMDRKAPSYAETGDNRVESYWMPAASYCIRPHKVEEQVADTVGMRAVAIRFADYHDEK